MTKISINFKNQHKTSPNLKITTNEIQIQKEVENYIKDLNEENIEPETPLHNKDPNTVILDFIIWLLGDEDGIEDGYQLTNHEEQEHYTWDLQKNKWTEPKRP